MLNFLLPDLSAYEVEISLVEDFQLVLTFLEFKKVLVILTDGHSNSGQVNGPALQLKNSGVVIFSVGIGNSLSMYELQVMASDPANQHVITLGNFSQLAWLAEQMPSQTCNGESYTHTVLVVVMIKMTVMKMHGNDNAC